MTWGVGVVVGVRVGVGVVVALVEGLAAGVDPLEQAASARAAPTTAITADPVARRRLPEPRTKVSGTAWI